MLTPAEVKQLKKRVEALKFSASETPEKWSYKMQLLLNMWKRIPADLMPTGRWQGRSRATT